MPTHRSDERGVALILALLLILALSALVASLTVTSQTETWSSLNYRLMTQARYGAESGINRTVNYLLNNYTPPVTGGSDPISSYNTAASPVTAASNGQAVILSGDGTVPANYPVSSVESDFSDAAHGTMTTGSLKVHYVASAELLSMGQVSVYGSSTPATIQTWKISSTGTVSGSSHAQVRVSAILEREATPVFQYAAFTTNNGCASLGFSGGGLTDSYDSTAIQYVNGTIATQAYGGDIGSNGNLTSSGSTTTVNGSLSTPRNGVGKCGQTVTAWTSNGNSTVTGGEIQLPQAVKYPTPTAPNPMPPTNSASFSSGTDCEGVSGCTVGGSGLVLAPGSYGNISLSGGTTLHLTAGSYTINSIKLSGNSTLVIDTGPVIMNVAGQDVTTPIDFTGGSITNASMNPSQFQILYAGTGAVNLTGSAQTSALVYAPNAAVTFTGGTDWYGAVIAGTLDDSGGTAIHYDRHLKQNTLNTISDYMLDSFNWKKS